MKRAYFVCLFLCLTTTFLRSQSNPVPLINQTASVASPISASQSDPKAQARILDSYGKLPLSFEANHGQTDARVKFMSRTSGYSLFLTGDEAVLALSGKKASTKAKIGDVGHVPKPGTAEPKVGDVLRMKLRNANPTAKVTGVDELAGTSNYFIGNDPAKWRTNVPTYAKVKYEGIYSGIDLVYYGTQRQLEYDFIVAPGADPHRIVFEVRGAKRIRKDAQGELVFKTDEDEIRWHRPVVYQEKNGTRQEIAAQYAITDKHHVGFELARYDTSKPLYIDPLIYSTYLGGSEYDYGQGIAVDSVGNAYVTGWTTSTNFPTMSPFQPTYGGGHYWGDAFVAKINPTGSAFVYSTYLGGSDDDGGIGIAADSAGNAYVAGYTYSTNFPTMNPLQAANGGGGHADAFVAKLNPVGSALVYSTYLGGSEHDISYGIAIDGAGNAYITGFTGSTDFRTTPGAFQATCNGGVYGCFYDWDAFVAKLNPTGSTLVYSTYLGGSAQEYGRGIAVDSWGNAYVTGLTYSSDFPTTPGAVQTVCNSGSGCVDDGDAFVAKLNPTGSTLVYSTYLGGNWFDEGNGIAVDSSGNAYVTGSTGSTNFPTTPGAFRTVCNFGTACRKYGDAFVAKLNASGSALLYSTYMGGSREDGGRGIAVDGAGIAYVTGYTRSFNFPVKSALQASHGDDAFVATLNPEGSALVYSTYLGGSGGGEGNGIAVDSADNAYVTGHTYSIDFPTMNPLQPAYGGNIDAFVSKIYIAEATTTTLSSSLTSSSYGQEVTFTALLTSSLGAPPDGETVTFMRGGTTVLGTGALSGGSASFTTSALPLGTILIKAMYGGDSNFAGSTSKVWQVVSKAKTATTLASSQNPSSSGQPVTFTASVVPQFGGKVTGTVTFYDGATGLTTVILSGGAAKFTTSKLTSGTHSITATYNGSTSFIGSSASLTQTVN
jgi:hypothetical protein